MPYRRRTNRRRRYPVKRRGNVRQIARKEAKKVLYRNIESKTLDGAIASTQIDFSGAVSNLLSDPSGATTISQGVAETQYIGTMIRPSYIKISYNWILADTTNMVRVIVIQCKGFFTPTVADILQSVGNVRTPLSDYDIDFNERYTVLADRRHSLEQNNNSQVIGKIRIPSAKLRRIKFTDAAGGYEVGGLYMAYVTDSAAVSHPLFQAYWRVHFKDA